MRRKAWLAAPWLGPLVIVIVVACSGRAADVTTVGSDSESHFLSHCTPGSCGEGLSCLFGVCTAMCAGDGDCSAWSADAVCRSVEDGSDSQSVCDVECLTAGDCREIGVGARCEGGVCRAGTAVLAGSFLRGCTEDRGCAEGLSCIDNTCSRWCDVDADCGISGASCSPYGNAPGNHCVHECEDVPEDRAASHRECAFLGEGGRCVLGSCREAFTGQCGDVGQGGAEWACYQDIAADAFRAGHAALLDAEPCLPARDGRFYDIEHRFCPDTSCANGEGGCPVRGLVLETQPLLEYISGDDRPPLLAAQGEVRLREPVRVPMDLLDPVERCEFSVGVRYWGIEFFDRYSYLSPGSAEALSMTPESQGFGISRQAIEGGLWQVTHDVEIRHSEVKGLAVDSPRGAIIENSEADIELLAGGDRCRVIQELVGVSVRGSLANVINEELLLWAQGWGGTLECSNCGGINCELACRFQ